MFESLQPISYAIATVFFVLSTSTIILRIYTRGFIVKSFGWDDWCMAAVLFFNAGQLAMLYYFLLNGGGLHITTVMTTNPQWLVNLTYALFVEEIYYIWMHWIIKMAFLLFYLRFANTRVFTTLVYCTMVLNTLFAASTWMLYCLQCIPLDAYFHPAAHPAVKCLDRSILAFVPAAFNVFIDILIVVLPIRPLWKIQVSLRKRLMLISIVSLGGIVVLISSLRMIVLREFQKETDITYTLGKLIIISSIEIDVAIMAANGPSLKTFWSKFISPSMHTTKGSDDQYSNTHKLTDLSSGQKKRTLVSQASCHVMSNFGPDQVIQREECQNDSEEELWKNDSAIVVTSSVGIETHSAESHETPPEFLQETYNNFDKV